MNKPRPAIDFLIIGAEKAGTTWLADQLRQHPDVFIPPEKELFYFNARFFESPELPNANHAKPREWFLSFFKNAAPRQIKGEASPAYLWDAAAPAAIHAFEPDLKLIAILRDPLERAFSQFLYYLQRGYFGNETFEEALDKRPDILTRGLYAEQLARFYALFPAEQVYVAFFDDLRADAGRFLFGVEGFLGVREYLPEGWERRANVTGRARFPFVNRALARLRYPVRKFSPPWLLDLIRRAGLAKWQEQIRLWNTRPLAEIPALRPETERRLRAYFRADVETLERLTGRHLDAWK